MKITNFTKAFDWLCAHLAEPIWRHDVDDVRSMAEQKMGETK